MDFTDYADTCIQLAPDLVNTLGTPSGNEHLPDPDALRGFLVDHDMDPPSRIGMKDVEEIHQLRTELRKVFEAETQADAAARINDLIVGAGTLPQLTDHDGHWHLHYTSTNAPLVDRLAAIVGIAMAQVLARYGKERFGICGGDECGDVFLDTSKNRSKRYCNDLCSNRANVRAHRARARAHQP